MAITLQQTDTAGPCAAVNIDSQATAGLNSTTSSKIATSGGTAGTGAVSLTIDINGGIQFYGAIFFQSGSGEPNSTSWEAGTVTAKLEITTANMNMNWNSFSVGFITSGCAATQITSGGTSQSIGSTGVLTSTLTLGASAGRNATDRVYIEYSIWNSAMSTQAFGFKPSQTIALPITQGAAAFLAPPALLVRQAVNRVATY